MRLLKASVIIMGVLIVVGLLGLVYAIVERAAGPAEDSAAAVATGEWQEDLLRLDLPEDTAVRRVVAAPGRVILHLSVPGRGEWIYVVPTDGPGRVLKIAVSGQ